MTKQPVTRVLQPSEQRQATLLIVNVSVEFDGYRVLRSDLEALRIRGYTQEFMSDLEALRIYGNTQVTGGSVLEASRIRGHTQDIVPQGIQALENR